MKEARALPQGWIWHFNGRDLGRQRRQKWPFRNVSHRRLPEKREGGERATAFSKTQTQIEQAIKIGIR